VANEQTSTVSVIDAATNQVTHTIHVRYNPDLVAVDPAIHTLYVGTEHDDGTLSAIDEATNQITHTIDIGAPVRGLAADPAARTAYVTSRGLVFVIDLNTNAIVARVRTPYGYAAAVDPVRHTAYVAGTDVLYVIQPCP
jgi:YVTN family beta-propeller protein